MNRQPLLILIGCLISYGSLYPFNFTAAAPDAMGLFFSDWKLFTSRGDVLGNIGLFVPWGLVGMQTSLSKGKWRRAATLTLGLGFLFALGTQILQIWVPSRDASLADVFWNLVGIALGIIGGVFIAAYRVTEAPAQRDVVLPSILLLGLILMEWLPLVPSLDLQLFKDALKSVFVAPPLTAGAVFPRIGLALLGGHLLSIMWGARKSLALLPLLLAVLYLGKFFLHAVQIDLSTPLAFCIGAAIWWTVAKKPLQTRHTIVLMVLLSTFTVGALAPFSFRDEAAAVSWMPFSSLLEGSMLSNVRSLLANMVIYVGILYIMGRNSSSYTAASVGLAVWVMLLEWMQTLIETRSADVTEPLLILVIGQLFNVLQRDLTVAPSALRKQAPLTSAEVIPTRTELSAGIKPVPAQLDVKRLVIPLVCAVATIAIGVATLLKLPGIPYNVKELFREDAVIFTSVFFAMALLWAGGGAVWLSTRVMSSRKPELQLPMLALLTSLISLTFVWLAVTTESLEDIAGSSNLFWFVTNKDIWGTAWREIFLHFNAPDIVGFLEHCVRYSALYAPLPIFLGFLMAWRQFPWVGRFSKWRAVALAISTLITLWLCKAIAFDWSSTDNLNELIARDGDWGWGGGGYLYGLLMLLCLNALLLAEIGGDQWKKLALALFSSLAALPLGWWLLNQGLEEHVEKYGFVFSGVQFLLGPDRENLVKPEMLFLRWCGVQLVAIAILSTGIRLGRIVFQAPVGVPSSIERPLKDKVIAASIFHSRH